MFNHEKVKTLTSAAFLTVSCVLLVILVFSSSLSAFYMRSFAEKVSDIKPPLLQEEPTNCLRDDRQIVTEGNSEDEESEISLWLESFEMQDWISCVGGTSQDAMTSHIIVAAALAVCYPSLVKPNLVGLAVNPLVKLVMAMNEKYSSTAAEILAEGMESTWKNPSTSVWIHDILVGILLPSLAMADVLGFLNVIESQIWSTASDSPVHFGKECRAFSVTFSCPVLDVHREKTIDPGNLAMRKTCLQSSMAALKEIARIFPMLAVNDPVTRLAIGDAIETVQTFGITKIKVLDASGPPGFPSLLGGASGMTVTTAISALSFSPDGEGFSANANRSSIMASVFSKGGDAKSQEKTNASNEMDRFKQLLHNIDLSYRIELVGQRKIKLIQHGRDLGTFQL
ncbi:hypothetical protein RND71_016787 [Anisodus tanguticus]|uniref:Uncharacterized protein n=1 Tax=Anisodus tanguticus TaxID=243964 RepID=A0AAE1S6U9_9SOLA|nr:hypothetical protein RND71_016787 [Anisodus tanguticus]